MGVRADILNASASSFEDIKPFNKNTLQYVGVAFQFDNITDFDKKQSDFYTAIKSILPHKIETPAHEGSFMLTVSPDNNQVGINQNSEIYTEYQYMDNRENPTIRVITNRKKIDFQCIDPKNNYTSFKNFLDIIWKIFKPFCRTHSDNLNLMGVVLRKINKIELDDNAKYLNQDILYELKMFENFTNANTYKEFVTVGEQEEIIEFRSGIIKDNSGNNQNLIIYDFTLKQDNPNKLQLEPKAINTLLEDFSKQIYNLYCFCVGKEYIKEVLNHE
jgi:hypothetical protein